MINGRKWLNSQLPAWSRARTRNWTGCPTRAGSPSGRCVREFSRCFPFLRGHSPLPLSSCLFPPAFSLPTQLSVGGLSGSTVQCCDLPFSINPLQFFRPESFINDLSYGYPQSSVRWSAALARRPLGFEIFRQEGI